MSAPDEKTHSEDGTATTCPSNRRAPLPKTLHNGVFGRKKPHKPKCIYRKHPRHAHQNVRGPETDTFTGQAEVTGNSENY